MGELPQRGIVEEPFGRASRNVIVIHIYMPYGSCCKIHLDDLKTVGEVSTFLSTRSRCPSNDSSYVLCLKKNFTTFHYWEVEVFIAWEVKVFIAWEVKVFIAWEVKVFIIGKSKCSLLGKSKCSLLGKPKCSLLGSRSVHYWEVEVFITGKCRSVHYWEVKVFITRKSKCSLLVLHTVYP